MAIRQNGVLGLDVVRKIYVPANGYFGRYLEILRNPGTTPITVDAAIETNLGSDSGTQVIATSSGDQLFDATDQWIVSDDPIDGSGDPSLAHVMEGASAPRALSFAQRSSDNLNYRWNGITIDPGQTVILMHFAAQHFTRLQVRAAAERLVQLPPEAIAGLSAEEASQIVNFAVPADLSSSLPAVQKPDAGTVTGRVFEYDGSTAIPSATVTFASDNVLFGNRVTVNANASGMFSVANAIRDTYTLTARHPATNIVSPAFAGSFDPGQLTSSLDVSFTNTGAISGTVRYQTGETVPSGTIQSPYFKSLAADGTYTLNGLAAGIYTVVVFVPNPQGDGLYASAQATVTAGQATTLDLTLPEHSGKQVRLKEPLAGGGTVAPGNFGLLALPDGSAGANDIQAALAAVTPADCYTLDVTTATGSKTNKVINGINARFDLPGGLPYPAPNVINYPRDASLIADPTRKLGLGDWDRNAYWLAKHGTALPAELQDASRYQVYLYELGETYARNGMRTIFPVTGSLPAGFALIVPPGPNVPVAANPTNANDPNFDGVPSRTVAANGQARRLVQVPLLQCIAEGVHGHGTYPTGGKYVEVFITEASTAAPEAAIYGEVVRAVTPSTNPDFHANVRLIR